MKKRAKIMQKIKNNKIMKELIIGLIIIISGLAMELVIAYLTRLF